MDANEEHQPESAATVSGGMGTDDTTLMERVELGSFVAAGDRLRVHHNTSKIIAALDTRTATQSSYVLVEEPDKWRGTQTS